MKKYTVITYGEGLALSSHVPKFLDGSAMENVFTIKRYDPHQSYDQFNGADFFLLSAKSYLEGRVEIYLDSIKKRFPDMTIVCKSVDKEQLAELLREGDEIDFIYYEDLFPVWNCMRELAQIKSTGAKITQLCIEQGSVTLKKVFGKMIALKFFNGINQFYQKSDAEDKPQIAEIASYVGRYDVVNRVKADALPQFIPAFARNIIARFT